MEVYEQYFNIEIGDVGYNNRLSNKAILRFMQEIASIHSEMVGFGLNTKDLTHIAWVLLNWKLEVFDRPKWNSKILIKTWPRCFDKISSRREFEMYDINGKVIAVASSKWVIINTLTNTIQKITPQLVEAYKCLDKKVFQIEPEDKLKEPATSLYSKTFSVQRRDIDTNNHVNNLCYLDYALETIPEDIYLNNEFSNIEIMYKKATKLGEDILCIYSKSNDQYIVTIKTIDGANLHSIIKMY